MKKSITASLIMLSLFATGGAAAPGPRRDPLLCIVDRSCASGVCVKAHPTDRFGTCCAAKGCPALGAQCGSIDNGCGTPIDCGQCGAGSLCIDNQCVIVTTTLPPTTTTTLPPTTTTTLPGSCPDATCNSSPLCNHDLDCYQNQTTEESCGVCVYSTFCNDPCTRSSDCGFGQVCIINTCCGASGVCANVCVPTPVTTTLPPPITTTLPPMITTTLPPMITTTLQPPITTTLPTTTTITLM